MPSATLVHSAKPSVKGSKAGRAEPENLSQADSRQPIDQRGLCMATLDPRLTVKHTNREFCRQFGVSSAEVCGRAFPELLHPSLQQPLTWRLSRLVEGQQQRFAARVAAVRHKESEFAAQLTAVAVSGATPGVSGILVLMSPSQAEDETGVLTDRRRFLTDLDARILEGIAGGVSTIPLASRLYLSRQGVEYHVTGLLRKLRVPNRAALVSRAYSLGILNVGSWPPKVMPDFIK